MVKYDLVSVGVLVEPEASLKSTASKTKFRDTTSPPSRNLTFGFEYRANMSDLIIKVSDPNLDIIKDKGCPIIDSSIKNSGNKMSKSNVGGSGPGSASVEKVGTLQRVDCSSFSGKSRLNSRSTIRNRPSCRKSRSDSQLLFDNGSSKAYVTGLKTNNIPSSALNNKSCDFYRQKFLQEGFLNQTADNSDWVNFSTMQKTAGQKVVNKLAAQQKILEEEAQKQRKKSLLGSNTSLSSGSSSGSDNENRNLNIKLSQKDFVPLKKKPNRLEPITLYAIKHSD